MYAENGVMFPYFQSFSPDVHQFDDLCYSQKSNSCLGSVVQSSVISDYDFGGEGDLFNAPEPVIELPLETLDAMLMIACGEDNLSSQELGVTGIESLQNEEFLSDVLNDYKEIETSPLSEVLNYKIPFKTDEIPIVKENVHPPGNGQIPKSVSSDCLSSMEWIHEAQMKHGVLNLMEVDFENVYGMRRAFSEGDIKNLENGNGSHRQPQIIMSEHTNTMEDRWQKLSRYRNKKSKRNFGRKIKYACRKALADSQPRIRGRFAKTEESEILRK